VAEPLAPVTASTVGDCDRDADLRPTDVGQVVAADGIQAWDRLDVAAAPDEQAAMAAAVGRPSAPAVVAADPYAEAGADRRPESVNPVPGLDVRPRVGSDFPSGPVVPSAVGPADARESDGVAGPGAPGRSSDLRRANGSSAAARVRWAAA
jgi:hypothetical protein